MKPGLEQRMRRITSRQNQALKDLRQGFHDAKLTDDGHAAIESMRVIEEAVRSGLRFKTLVFSDSGAARAERLLSQIAAATDVLIVSDEIFENIVATESPQGIAALVAAKRFEAEQIFSGTPPLIVIAAGVQDPGNLGTMIRTAEAFGAAGLISTEGTVGLWNPKVVRASAGSVFRLPVLAMKSSELIALATRHGVRLIATSSHKGAPLPEPNLTGGVAICIGNEGAGLSREIARAVQETFVIPHSATVESLNAGIAASIVLYEAARQRKA